MSPQVTNKRHSRHPLIWVEAAGPQLRRKVQDALGEPFGRLVFHDKHPRTADSERPDLIIAAAEASSEAAQLRQKSGREAVPLLLFASELDEQLEQLIAKSETIDFVVSPFTTAELSIRAKKLLAGNFEGNQRSRPPVQLSTSLEDQHWRLMVDSIDDYGIFLVDLQGQVVTWNSGAVELTGYSADEALGRPFASVYTPENGQRERMTKAFDVARETGRYEDVGLRRRRDGSTYNAQLIIRRVENEGGDLLGFATIIRDVTARARAERALKESEAKFRTIADAMPQMVWSTLPDGYHDYYNKRWYDYTGMPEGSTDGDGWNGMFHPDDQPRAWRLWSHSLATGEPYEIEYRVRHHSGEYHWTLGRALPIRDDDGKIVRWMGTCTVIHDQKQAEAALQEASRRKDEFLAMLAHELRNPLGPLHNSMVLMRQAGPHNPQADSALAVAERQVGHMTRLVNDLVDVARITRGKMQLRKQNCELNEIVRQAVDDSQSRFRDKGIELHLKCLDDPLWTWGDRTRIAQVIGNLLHNASKFTHAGGAVRVSTSLRSSPDGKHAQVLVQDSGVGIDPDLASRLFDPFVQADQDLSRADGGLGLGLAVVKGFMELHHGSVEAHSEGLGRGTTFVLDFPCEAKARPSESVPPTRSDKAARPWRIVLVEDNHDMLDTLATLLRAEGHEVATAEDGPSGLEAVNTTQPDLVICDIGLPGAMNGYALARAVRASRDPALSEVFLVALSGYSQDSDRQKSRDSGFELHLLKPLDFDELRTLLASNQSRMSSASR